MKLLVADKYLLSICLCLSVYVAERAGTKSQKTWVLLLELPLPTCVTTNNSLSVSHHCAHLNNVFQFLLPEFKDPSFSLDPSNKGRLGLIIHTSLIEQSTLGLKLIAISPEIFPITEGCLLYNLEVFRSNSHLGHFLFCWMLWIAAASLPLSL